MFLNNSSHWFSAAFPHSLYMHYSIFSSHCACEPTLAEIRDGPVLSSVPPPGRSSLRLCWTGLAGQLDEGNYLFRLSGFPKIRWVFNTRAGTIIKSLAFQYFSPPVLSLCLHIPHGQAAIVLKVGMVLVPEIPESTGVDPMVILFPYWFADFKRKVKRHTFFWLSVSSQSLPKLIWGERKVHRTLALISHLFARPFLCWMDLSLLMALNLKKNDLYVFRLIKFISKFLCKRWYSPSLKDIFLITQINTRFILHIDFPGLS